MALVWTHEESVAIAESLVACFFPLKTDGGIPTLEPILEKLVLADPYTAKCFVELWYGETGYYLPEPVEAKDDPLFDRIACIIAASKGEPKNDTH